MAFWSKFSLPLRPVFASLRLCVFASLRLCVFASLRLCDSGPATRSPATAVLPIAGTRRGQDRRRDHDDSHRRRQPARDAKRVSATGVAGPRPHLDPVAVRRRDGRLVGLRLVLAARLGPAEQAAGVAQRNRLCVAGDAVSPRNRLRRGRDPRPDAAPLAVVAGRASARPNSGLADALQLRPQVAAAGRRGDAPRSQHQPARHELPPGQDLRRAGRGRRGGDRLPGVARVARAVRHRRPGRHLSLFRPRAEPPHRGSGDLQQAADPLVHAVGGLRDQHRLRLPFAAGRDRARGAERWRSGTSTPPAQATRDRSPPASARPPTSLRRWKRRRCR